MQHLSEKKYLSQLAKEYPTIAAASTEIINLQAILKLPKPTEHFMSDLHGECEAFTHILGNASGVVREKVDRALQGMVSEQERAELATLIYYPAQKLEQMKPMAEDLDAWYRTTLLRLVDVCRMASSKYTRSFVRKRMPVEFSYIIDELLHAHFEDHDKEGYYHRILSSILDIGRADDFIVAMAQLIQRLAVFRLHIVGDVFDRGPRPDIILDELMEHHSVDIQWGNHDVEWLGAAAGSAVCIASVIHVTLSYNNLETLEDGYGINLRPLALFAEEVYRSTDCSLFEPKLQDDADYTPTDIARVARMHKAIVVMLHKLECAAIARNPDFDMQDRALLMRVDWAAQSVVVDGKEYRMRDCDFPTVDPKAPALLTHDEQDVLDKLCQSFRHSERLQRHARFLYAKGSMYKIVNGNLLFHGAVPMTHDGALQTVHFGGKDYTGRAWMDQCERMARQGFFALAGSRARQQGQDFLWYLWCGKASPVFGRDKMAVFESLFIGEEAACIERKNGYYTCTEGEDRALVERTVTLLFDAFGLDRACGHIVNGHVPVRATSGETPIKAGGKLIVIDGGFCKAYHKRTGIAGYTLVSSSRGLSLRSHGNFESTSTAVRENADILSSVDIFETNEQRLCVEDTDEGTRLKEQIADLKDLLAAYMTGKLNEQA